MSDWFAELFDERYLAFYDELLDASVAEADVDFVDRALALPASSSILDLGCGFGRHAIGLARRGYRLDGLDLSPTMIALARRHAREAGVTVEWRERDMRDLDGLGPFDACICLYTAFGFFDDADNRGVLAGVADRLRPGGLFMLDVANPLALLRAWPQRSWRESASGVRLESSRFEPLSGRVVSRRTLLPPDGQRVDLPETSVRMYPPHELGGLLRETGFAVEQVYGSLRDDPFEWNRSLRQVWVARR